MKVFGVSEVFWVDFGFFWFLPLVCMLYIGIILGFIGFIGFYSVISFIISLYTPSFILLAGYLFFSFKLISTAWSDTRLSLLSICSLIFWVRRSSGRYLFNKNCQPLLFVRFFGFFAVAKE